MKLTLGQAAKETGVSKGTLSKAVKSGKLSAERNDDGSFAIDPAELFRVFPKQSETVTGERLETPDRVAETPLENMRLEVELEAVRKEATILRETLDDLRSDRDAWRQQAERQSLLLEDRRRKEVGATQSGWLGRLFGGGERSGE